MQLSIFGVATFLAGALAAEAQAAKYYTLSTKSASPSVNNLPLSVRNGKVAAFRGAPAGKWFTSTYAPTGTLSFHSEDSTHQLALQLQSTGLLQLVDLVSPTAESTRGKPTEWSVFAIGPNNQLQVKDGANIPSRQWISYLDTDGAQYVGLWDGFTRLPRTFANITVTVNPSA